METENDYAFIEDGDPLRAQQRVARYKRNGKMRKDMPCVFCGFTGQTQAHHEDYTKPFQVIHLCPKCHSRIHSIRNEYNVKKIKVSFEPTDGYNEENTGTRQ